MSIITRLDARYVSSDDRRATMTAWVAGTMDMGGWTDGNETAFIAAVQSEYLYGTGDDLAASDIVILPAVALDDEDELAAADALEDASWLGAAASRDTVVSAMAAFRASECEARFY